MKRTSLFKVIICSVLGLAMMSCSNDQQPVEEPEVTYTLSADKTEAEINEMITFTVTSSTGEDVTAEWSICDESLCFTGNKVSYMEAGTHTIAAHYRLDDSIEAQNTVTVTIKSSAAGDEEPVESISPLNPDATYEIYFEGESPLYIYYDYVKFYVREIIDGKVTNENFRNFKIGLVGSERADRFEPGKEYMFTETGTYEFDAVIYYMKDGHIYEEKADNTVTIVANEKQTDGFTDDYFHRVLFIKWTATWCENCPEMERAINNIMDSYLLKNRVVPVAMHERGRDYCYPGPEVGKMCDDTESDYNIWGIPGCVIDFDKDLSSVGAVEEYVEKYIKTSLVRNDAGKVPGIKISTSLSGRTLSYKVESAIRETGDYLLGLFFVENGLLTYQSGTPNKEMVQNHILFHSLTSGVSSFGLHECGTLTDGTDFEYSGTFEIPVHEEPADFVFENCQIVYFICKTDESVEPYGYYCANAGVVDMGKSTEYEYEPRFVD